MSMRKRRESRQEEMFVQTSALPDSPGHPFYTQLNELLAVHGFDLFVEERCSSYYAETLGRPSIPPGVYFRMLMIGYFEGLGSERGIDWRVADSLALRQFLGYALTETTPDHSSLSRIRQRLPLEVHQEVFNWVLKVLALEGLLKGKSVAVDATTLEANMPIVVAFAVTAGSRCGVSTASFSNGRLLIYLKPAVCGGCFYEADKTFSNVCSFTCVDSTSVCSCASSSVKALHGA